ncbi:MAG: hypothetical protein U0871_29495 [Gemmataceae bacterium]
MSEQVWLVMLGWVGNPMTNHAQAEALGLDPTNYRNYREARHLPFRVLLQTLTGLPVTRDFIDIRTENPISVEDRSGCIIDGLRSEGVIDTAVAHALNVGYEHWSGSPPTVPADDRSAFDLATLYAEERPLPPQWAIVAEMVFTVLEGHARFDPAA